MAFFWAAVIDFESLPVVGCVTITSRTGLSPFRIYSETVTESLSPLLVTDGTLVTFPINLAIIGASGQSALSIGSSTWEKITISNELSLTKYENFPWTRYTAFVCNAPPVKGSEGSSLLSVVISGSGIKYVKCIRCGSPSGM